MTPRTICSSALVTQSQFRTCRLRKSTGTFQFAAKKLLGGLGMHRYVPLLGESAEALELPSNSHECWPIRQHVLALSLSWIQES